MSTLSVAGLEALLQRLGLEVPVPSFAGADVLNKPLDIARSYLAAIISSLAECDAATAYGAVTCPSQMDNGDLVVVPPKTRPEGKAERDGVRDHAEGMVSSAQPSTWAFKHA